jgi:hypothetical protein
LKIDPSTKEVVKLGTLLKITLDILKKFQVSKEFLQMVLNTYDPKIFTEQAGIYVGLSVLKTFFKDINFWTDESTFGPKLNFDNFLVQAVKNDESSADYKSFKDVPKEVDIMVECKGREQEPPGYALYKGERQVLYSMLNAQIKKQKIHQGFITSLHKDLKPPLLIIEIMNNSK